MSEGDEDDEIGVIKDDVSHGKVADNPRLYADQIPKLIRDKFEIFSYRGAAAVLSQSFPVQFNQIIDALMRLKISKTMIRTPGGSKGPIAKYVDTLFSSDWQETRISADLQVKLHHATQNTLIGEYIREGFLDGHRIDFLNGKVAVDLEWNSKDQTYDRDLYAFSAFHEAGDN